MRTIIAVLVLALVASAAARTTSKQSNKIQNHAAADPEERSLCSPGYFACNNGMCIPEEFVCDGVFNCITGNDEDNCAGLTGPGYTRVYSGYGQSGYYYDFTDYVPDLKMYDFDNAIRSVCSTGIWFYYEEVEYNLYPGSVYWMHGVDYCGDMPSEYSDTTSSLRYGGSPSLLNEDSFTLYDGVGFTGSEFYGSADTYPTVQYMDDLASSMLLTGLSPWTFFAESNYGGFAMCVYPSTDHDVGADGTKLDFGIFASVTDVGIPDNSINSVAKGCYSNNIVVAPKMEALHRDQNGAMGFIQLNKE